MPNKLLNLVDSRILILYHKARTFSCILLSLAVCFPSLSRRAFRSSWRPVCRDASEQPTKEFGKKDGEENGEKEGQVRMGSLSPISVVLGCYLM